MDKLFLILFVSLLCISRSTQDEPDTTSTSTPIQEQVSVASSVNKFGYKLMLEMMKQKENKNIVMSPTGIAGLLAMTLLGSVGSSYNELTKALGFSQDILENRKSHEKFGNLLQKLNVNADTSPEVKDELSTMYNGNDSLNGTSADLKDIQTRTLYANAIVGDAKTQIRSIYRDYLNNIYHGDALTAHFEDVLASQQLINEWVSNHTEGQIEDFLDELLPASTKVVLLSALYFSSQWASPFEVNYTANMTFQGPSGDVTAALMFNIGKYDYIYKSLNDVHIIALPYNDNVTTMYVMQPVRRRKQDLFDVMQHLDYPTIEQLIENMTSEDCIVRFPKMELATKTNLRMPLMGLGIKSLFTPGEANFALMVNADRNNTSRNDDSDLLTRIYTDENIKKVNDVINNLPNPGVHVDSVLHDVKLTVNEYGTVAVAATGGFFPRSARTFYANSPFYMFIRNNKTKLVTFSSVIYDPTTT